MLLLYHFIYKNIENITVFVAPQARYGSRLNAVVAKSLVRTIYIYKWPRLFGELYRGTLAELGKSVWHGSYTAYELHRNEFLRFCSPGNPSIECRFRPETTAKIVIFTSSNEIEISTFWTWYRHSIGVLWFLGVLWTSGKVNCGHSDMSGECSHKIKCSHEKKLVILVWNHIVETQSDFLVMFLTV